MIPIKQITGTISKVREISPTAREYTITPTEPLLFIAGAFVNVFVEHNGETFRRAFSMSSDDQDNHSFTVTIRLSRDGALTPILWSKDFTGETVRLMGPLGLNTADKMHSNRVFLFGFGVGAGVVKSLAAHLVKRDHLQSLTVVTGNRTIDEILHKDYFDELSAKNIKLQVKYVVSDKNQTEYPIGYIQEHISDYDFNHADVYMCGQGVACSALETAIKATNPTDCHFFIEDFH